MRCNPLTPAPLPKGEGQREEPLLRGEGKIACRPSQRRGLLCLPSPLGRGVGSEGRAIALHLTQRALLALVLLILPAQRALADDPDQPEPPLRLKKKDRPMPPTPPKEQEKPTRPAVKAPPVDQDTPGEANPRETLTRITRNMQQSAERLEAKDPREPTRRVQQTIVADLDSLIRQREQDERQPQQNQQQNPSQPNEQQQERQRRRQQRQQRQQREQRPMPMPQPKLEPETRPGAGRGANEDLNKIADLYKDVWGHLPESLRLEMDQYGREQFMAKYRDILKQYYGTVAEKGRRKGD